MKKMSHKAHGQSEKPGLYRCGACRKSYTRPDHLIRHVRSHTAEKPFICDICHKGFGRIDLLRRHTQSHSSPQDQPRVHKISTSKPRVSRACKDCAAAKLKCDDDKPCQRCVKRNVTCHWPQERESTDLPDPNGSETLPSDSDGDPVGVNFEKRTEISGDTHPQDSSHLLASDIDITQTTDAQHDIQTFTHLPSVAELGADTTQTNFPNNWELEDDIRLPLMAFDDLDDVGDVNRDVTMDLGLTDGDLEFIRSLHSHENFYENWVSTERLSKGGQESDVQHVNPTSGEISDDSPFTDWTPRAEDNAYMDQVYLSVPKHLDNPELTGISKPKITSGRLSQESRDSAFAIVMQVSSRQTHNTDRIIKCFPSAELLYSLIHDYILWHRNQLDSWIHEPSMQLDSACPEMIIALAAAGGALCSVEAIQNLGYALLEVGRLHLCQRFEENNCITRHLQELQAFALILHIGLWSGHKRRIEIAESFAQTIITMLRRASRFNREIYPTIVPQDDDHGDVLEEKWRKWSEAESFKRLVYHMFIHDVQASVSLSINPLLSYIELDLPLPCCRTLWDAKSALEWKNCFVENPPEPMDSLPSVSRSLHNISVLNTFHSQLDIGLAGFISLHGIFTMVIDCNRARRGPYSSLRGLVFQSWQHELQQTLEQFEITIIEPLQEHAQEMSLLYHLVSLSLCVPLHELEIFAGKDGLKRSGEIYDEVIKQISPANIRQAMWHAGQVYRIVKLLPYKLANGLCATCLYFAALTLWMYSSFTGGKPLSQPGRKSDLGVSKLFFLDDEVDRTALRRFTLAEDGIPALSSVQKPACLTDRAAIMCLFRDLRWLKHPGGATRGQARILHNTFCALGGLIV